MFENYAVLSDEQLIVKKVVLVYDLYDIIK